MHDTALTIGQLAIEIYADIKKPRILELGSMDVNGSLRQFAPAACEYIGVDLEEGEGVDIVVEAGGRLPFEDGQFHLVIASSVFEHDPAFWLTFLELGRVLRDGGFLYINAPSNGAVHRYPEDHWRFYPDAGSALERWARSQGAAMNLVESFTARRNKDCWNDFVAVFLKGPADGKLPAKNIVNSVGGLNIKTIGSDEIRNFQAESEDMEFLVNANSRVLKLTDEIEKTRINSQNLIEENSKLISISNERNNHIASLQGVIEKEREYNDANQRNIGKQVKEIEKLSDQLSQVELALRERDDELEQARLAREQLVREKTEGDDRRDLIERQLKAEHALEQERRSNAESKLVENSREIAQLQQLLAATKDRATLTAEQNDWLRELGTALIERPRWWSLLPAGMRRKCEQRWLRQRLIFDADAYMKLHADVAAERMDPLRHFIMHGINEGRMLIR